MPTVSVRIDEDDVDRLYNTGNGTGKYNSIKKSVKRVLDFWDKHHGGDLTKIIEVDSCENCPLMEYRPYVELGLNNICQHVGSEGMIIKNIDVIDPGCLLKDFE